MALGHKQGKRLIGGEPFEALFTCDEPNLSWTKQQRLTRIEA